MNLENIKELVCIFKNADYRDLFGALVLNEKIDYLHDLEDLQEKDIEYLEELYANFMESDLQLIDLETLEDLGLWKSKEKTH